MTFPNQAEQTYKAQTLPASDDLLGAVVDVMLRAVRSIGHAGFMLWKQK